MIIILLYFSTSTKNGHNFMNRNYGEYKLAKNSFWGACSYNDS